MARILKDFAALEAYLALCGPGPHVVSAITPLRG
jgi:hypothetical protein